MTGLPALSANRGRAGGSFTGSIPVRQNSDVARNGVSSDRVLSPLRRDA